MISGGKEVENRGNIPHNRHRAGIKCRNKGQGKNIRDMQAIILAAGMGKRLGELTQGNTKCMIRVGGETLIERVLRQLDALHLSRIIIVIG